MAQDPLQILYKVKRNADDIVMPDGNVFNGVTQACNFYEIVDPVVAHNRVSLYGYTKVDAVLTPKNIDKVVVNKITYRSLMDAFNKIGKVSFSTFQSRIRSGHDINYCLGVDF